MSATEAVLFFAGALAGFFSGASAVIIWAVLAARAVLGSGKGLSIVLRRDAGPAPPAAVGPDGDDGPDGEDGPDTSDPDWWKKKK